MQAMDITPLGHSSFKIRGKTATIVCDPYDSAMVGMKFPKHTTADIVTISHHHKDHDMASVVEGSPFVVDGPGEYEIKGVGIIGERTFHDTKNGSQRGTNTMYRMDVDGVIIVHAGDLGHSLSGEAVDSLDGVDILMIPVGGFYTIGPKEAAAVVSEVEPTIVIPMHYGKAPLLPVSDFLKEMGKEGISPVPKLTITKEKFPGELTVVVLS